MDQSSPAFVVQIPLLSLLPPEDEELKCMAQILHNKSFRSLQELWELKAELGSWKEVHGVYCSQLNASFRDGGDRTAAQVVQAMRRMEAATNESLKVEYAQFKLLNDLNEVVTLDWPTLGALVDRALMTKAGMPDGLKSCCWNCAKRGCVLLKCGKCLKASYCSRECQEAAWWHHKRTSTREFACMQSISAVINK